MERIEKMIQNISILLEPNNEFSEEKQVNEEKTLIDFEDESFDEAYEYDYEDDKPRKLEEIMQWSEEFYEKIWFDRHLTLMYRVENKGESIDLEIRKGAIEFANKMIEKYGEGNLRPYSDFE